jgi:hypothetical protein
LAVLGSNGLNQRRRHCWPFHTYHTQSPQRPLLTAGSKHSPAAPHKGQRLHQPPGTMPGASARLLRLALPTAGVLMFRRWPAASPWIASRCPAVQRSWAYENGRSIDRLSRPAKVSQNETVFHHAMIPSASVRASPWKVVPCPCRAARHGQVRPRCYSGVAPASSRCGSHVG